MTLSLEFIREHLETNPDSATFAYYADLLLKSGDTAEAYRVCSDGLEMYPEFATGWYIFGKIARERDEQEFAKTCWLKALTLDSMALNAAKDVLNLEEVTLTFEETESTAQALLEINKDHELALERLNNLETRTLEDESGEDDHAEREAAPPETEETMEQPDDSSEEETDAPAETVAKDDDAPKNTVLDFDFDEVEEEPEEFVDEAHSDVPAEQADHDALQHAFEAAYQDRPEFKAPDIDVEVPDEDAPEVDEDFTPPSFQPPVLEEGRHVDEKPEGDTPESPDEMLEGEDIPAEDTTEDDPDEIPVADSTKAPADFMAEKSSIKITTRMATFTFAGVLKSQGLYEQAYQVLELMRKKSDDIDRIEQEQAELEDLMSQRRNQERFAD